MHNFRRFLLLLIVSLLAVSSLLVAGGRVPFPGTPGPDFDWDVQRVHQQAISALQPDLVLLGDSLAEENVDMDLLAQETGLTNYRMGFGGSASALWYLAIKNNVLPASHRPKYLVILFRDSEMTAPNYRVGGKLFAALDEYATPEDALVIERAYLQFMNPLDAFAETYLPPYAYRLSFHAIMDRHVYALPFVTMRCGKRCLDKAMLNVFNFRNNAAPDQVGGSLDPEEHLLYSPAGLDFDAQVDRSFLPEIIRLSRENDIRLILVRAKTPRFEGTAKPRGLDEYLADLGAYVAANGAWYVDLSDDSRLALDDFIDNYHVLPEARAKYTQALAEAILSVIR
ncbi:MAG: hypothetical protein AB1750_03700 [Chloroflexota bacterium]